MQENEIFLRALETGNRDTMRNVAKADLHNHSGLGCRRTVFEKKYNIVLPPAPARMHDISDMDGYLEKFLMPHFSKREEFEFSVESTLLEAIADGVTIIETSADCFFSTYYDDGVKGFSAFIEGLQKKYRSEILFLPEIGTSRESYEKKQEALMMACIESGVFKSLDIYGQELAKDAEVFVPLFRRAETLGLKRKAHVGEFGDAASVRRTCELLHLDAVQHGIFAVSDMDVLRYLRENEIICNVCPSSNVAFGRCESLKHHPLRRMLDAGVRVTINSDDIYFFEQNVSDEFINLYKTGMYSPEELNTIRKNGLDE